MTISISLSIIVICFIAGAVAALTQWLCAKGGLPGWLTTLLTFFFALLVFASLHG